MLVISRLVFMQEIKGTEMKNSPAIQRNENAVNILVVKKGNKYQKPTGVKCKQEKKQLVFPSVCEEAITAISQQKIQRKLLRKLRVELAE